MKNAKILFCNELTLEDERRIKLDYYLTECCTEEDQSKAYYGIGINKHVDGVTESEEVLGISFSKDRVVAIINQLFRNTVTPISMIGILDDLIGEGSYS